MLDNYILAEETITKKLSKDHPMYPFMVCSLYGLLCKYSNHKDIVIDLIKMTDIIFEKGTIEEILERHNIPQDFANPVHDDESIPVETYGVSNQGHSFSMNDLGGITYSRERPFVVCSTSKTDMTRLLNTFCHEMGHLIKGEENGAYNYQDDEYDVFVIRTGLAHYVYAYKNDYSELTFSPNYSILDETINCIQTTDIMREILTLKDFVWDINIINFINSLDQELLLKDQGYEATCLLVRKLWENDSFKEMIEENIVLGKMDNIISKYDSIMGDNEFDRMSKKLDDLYNLPEGVSDNIFNFYIDSFIDITNAYKERVKQKVKQ